MRSFTYNGHSVRIGIMMPMHDLWVAADTTNGQNPVQFLESAYGRKQVARICEELELPHNQALDLREEGGLLFTWCHYEIAKAYAASLDPKLLAMLCDPDLHVHPEAVAPSPLVLLEIYLKMHSEDGATLATPATAASILGMRTQDLMEYLLEIGWLENLVRGKRERCQGTMNAVNNGVVVNHRVEYNYPGETIIHQVPRLTSRGIVMLRRMALEEAEKRFVA